mmetsp:Transcript_24563/g.49779  ORF Transcript_24563/g.49779 Transcript_24563/m.49779 type:complete len:131 (-) Transcript_24563:155-547(-)
MRTSATLNLDGAVIGHLPPRFLIYSQSCRHGRMTTAPLRVLLPGERKARPENVEHLLPIAVQHGAEVSLRTVLVGGTLLGFVDDVVYRFHVPRRRAEETSSGRTSRPRSAKPATAVLMAAFRDALSPTLG